MPNLILIESGKREETAVFCIPSQAYYSTMTFILKMHIWKIFKKSSIYC